MGTRPGSGQSAPHERHHDVHVRQQSPNLQYHDGIHALQEPHSRTATNEYCVYQVRDGRNTEDVVDGQGDVRGYESCGAWVGDVEGKWDGLVPDNEK